MERKKTWERRPASDSPSRACFVLFVWAGAGVQLRRVPSRAAAVQVGVGLDVRVRVRERLLQRVLHQPAVP